MTRDDIRKLIGGYATGTLTEAERRILFEAALDDQELFDELAREQALKEMLEEPGAKSRLIAALAEASPVPKLAWWKTPITWVAAALAAAAVLALVIVRQPQPSQYAQVRTEAPAPPSVPAPSVPAASAAPQPARPSNEPVQSKEPAAPPAPLAQPPAALAKKTEPAKDTDASKTGNLRGTGEAKEADTALAEPAASAEKAERSEKRDTQEDAKAPQLKAQAVGAQAAPAPQPASGFRQLSQAGQQQAGNQQQQQVQSGPAPQSRRAPAAAGRAGGVIGGVARAPSFLVSRRPRFAFDYSIESGPQLVIKAAANGYLSVSATESKSRIFPASGEGAVAAGSTTRIPIPADVQTVTIVFSASPGDAVDEISSTKDAPTGTVEDPNPSPNSRLAIELKVQP